MVLQFGWNLHLAVTALECGEAVAENVVMFAEQAQPAIIMIEGSRVTWPLTVRVKPPLLKELQRKPADTFTMDSSGVGPWSSPMQIWQFWQKGQYED